MMGIILGTMKGGLMLLLLSNRSTAGAVVETFCFLGAAASLVPSILLGLWGAWRLIGAAMELFSYGLNLSKRRTA